MVVAHIYVHTSCGLVQYVKTESQAKDESQDSTASGSQKVHPTL